MEQGDPETLGLALLIAFFRPLRREGFRGLFPALRSGGGWLRRKILCRFLFWLRYFFRLVGREGLCRGFPPLRRCGGVCCGFSIVA